MRFVRTIKHQIFSVISHIKLKVSIGNISISVNLHVLCRRAVGHHHRRRRRRRRRHHHTRFVSTPFEQKLYPEKSVTRALSQCVAAAACQYVGFIFLSEFRTPCVMCCNFVYRLPSFKCYCLFHAFYLSTGHTCGVSRYDIGHEKNDSRSRVGSP